jgi:RNA polymerase sigma-70 factor, ECF subfamily
MERHAGMADCGTSVFGPASCAPGTPPSVPITEQFWPDSAAFTRVLERARACDAEAFSLLYRRFLPVIYRFVLARVGEVPLTEDLTSETFFAALSGITSVRAQDELGFATWLLGIARHKLGQHFRRLKSRREIPLTASAAEAAEPRATADEDDPLSVLTARESWAEVVAALDRLTVEQRTVLLHRCILGRSADEIAHLMGKPANAIYGLQFRALAALARHLERSGSPDTVRRPTNGPARERRSGHAAR